MILYILKSIGSSALLLLIYHFSLEEEKMHRFNRFYLLFAIVFSFAVPFVHFQKKIDVPSVYQKIVSVENNIEKQAITVLPMNSNLPIERSFDWLIVIVAVYTLLTFVLLVRFAKNIFQFYFKIKKNPVINYSNSKLILENERHLPYSFLNYIFVNKEDFYQGKIEKEILQHESAHVTQKHSLDILFIELVLIFAWINPLLFFYRKAIQLNHEFLADESVLKSFDTYQYQLLLFNKISSKKNFTLSSSFNYSLTKKRLLMMTKKSSTSTAILKSIALIPVFALATFIFSKKTFAQDNEKLPANADLEQAANTKSVGATQQEMAEYQSILNKYSHEGKGWKNELRKKITIEDENRLGKIFAKMNKEQMQKQIVVCIPKPPVLPKNVPTQEQLDSWKDAKTFGVWLDGKRITNDELNNYKTSDFSNAFVSKLMKNALPKNETYTFQIDLMTNDYYKAYYDKAINNPSKYFVSFVHKKDNQLSKKVE